MPYGIEEVNMTEQEWLNSNDPTSMLEHAITGRKCDNSLYCPSDRKLRLFACACAIKCYGFAHATAMGPGKGGYGVWYETGEADPDDSEDTAGSPLHNARSWVRSQSNQSGVEDGITQSEKANLLRDIVSPFRPPMLVDNLPPPSRLSNKRLWIKREWLTPTVISLARAAYLERSGWKCDTCKGSTVVRSLRAVTGRGSDPCPDCHGAGCIDDGTLDPVRLAVLADALEEAGCSEVTCPWCDQGWLPKTGTPDAGMMSRCPDCRGTGRITHSLLAHLRSPGPHVRGCWAVDVVLGNS
jgi:hypothetical protein